MAKKNKTFYRSVSVTREAVDEENRTVSLSFSSEEPYERFNSRYGGAYLEVLGHSSGEVDLSFIASGRAPLLRDHDPLKQIGVVSSVDVSEGRGKALVKLSQNEEGQAELTDILDGIRVNVSVGYYIEQETVVGERDGKKIVRVNRWRPIEVSTVSIPADETVGIGRAAEDDDETPISNNKEETKMTIENNETLNVQEITANARKAEQARVREISTLGAKYGMAKAADEFVRNDKSAEEFRAYVLENLDTKAAATAVKSEKSEIGLTDKEVKNYSFMRALRSQMDPRFAKEAGFELEVSRAAAQAAGVEARGIMIPYDVLMVRNLQAGGAANGANLVATDLLGGSFIDLLRSRVVVAGLGATMLTGLRGSVAIPRQTAGATAYWLTPEGQAVTTSDQTMDQVTLSPKTVGATTDYTRQLMLQSSVDVENFVRSDLAATLAIAIDKAALYGNTAGAPKGIANTASINTIDIPTGAPTFGNVVAMEAAVDTYNALTGSLAYLAAPGVKGNMKVTSVDSGSGRFVWEGNSVNGYRAEASSIVTAGDIFFGDWSALLIGMWGGLDITVDPYSLSTSGGVRVVALQSVDVAVRTPRSFVYGV